MEAITHFTKQSLKPNTPDLRPGDTVRVHQKIREGGKERIQIFEGTVLAVRGGTSINSSYVVRRIASNGVGVEKVFPLHSPNVVKVERLKSSKVRQARLFYMRERFGRGARMKNETKSNATWESMAGITDEIEEASNEGDTMEPTPVFETPETEVEDTDQAEKSTLEQDSRIQETANEDEAAVLTPDKEKSEEAADEETNE